MASIDHSHKDYVQACRARIPTFARSQYGIRGSLRLNRHAWGMDIFIAPYNFFLGMPNFLLRLLTSSLSLVRLQKASRRMSAFHLGMPTHVHHELKAKLHSDFFELPETDESPLKKSISEPIDIYLQTRNIAADITAGTIAAIVGLLMFNQFTPGSISAGSVIADWAGREQAASQFLLGETLGGVWYSVFPVSPPMWLIAASFAVVMLVISVISAFAGFLHDPLQLWAGIHERRLHKLLDAVEEQLVHADDAIGFRPKDTFVGRIYDVVDWVKGLLP